MQGRRILLGLAMASGGAAILANRYGGETDVVALIRRWWPLALIGLGIINLARLGKRRWALIGPALTIAVGTVILLVPTNLINRPRFPLLWPTAIVAAGVAIALAGADWTNHDLTIRSEVRRLVVLRGARIVSRAQPFWRATFTVVLGSLELHLEEAALHHSGCVVNLNIVAGSVEVRVPSSVRVHIRRPFLVTKEGRQPSDPPPALPPHLTISVLGLFASVTTQQSLGPSSWSDSPTSPY